MNSRLKYDPTHKKYRCGYGVHLKEQREALDVMFELMDNGYFDTKETAKRKEPPVKPCQKVSKI